MHRSLILLLLLSAACGGERPVPPAPPPVVVRKTDVVDPAPPAEEPRPQRRMAVEGPLLRGPYVQAVGTDRATVCFETVAPAEGRVACDGRTIVGPRGRRHQIEISGLQPGRRYSYTVQPGDIPGGFRTSPDGEKDVFFLAWGDSRTYYERLAKVAALAAKESADFSVHTGDLVEEGTIDEEWDRFFEAAAPLLRTGALWPSIGNHETGAKQYFDLFILPDPEHWYAFTAGPAQFFILDSNYDQRRNPKQIAWFEEALKKSTARFKFVVCHHPLVSNPDDDFVFDKTSSMYGIYGRMIEDAKVAAVFQGHNHNYQRAERKGVTYITTGGGGAPLYPVGDPSAETKFAREIQHYVRVRLSGRTMTLEAVDWNGVMMDRDEKLLGP